MQNYIYSLYAEKIYFTQRKRANKQSLIFKIFFRGFDEHIKKPSIRKCRASCVDFFYTLYLFRT